MPTLAEIRARLIAEQTKNERSSGGGDNASYPFWDIPENKSATVRFLPDADENAEYFWVERLVIKLPFPYVKGQNDSKVVSVNVPCLDMWPDTRGRDPILNETKKWWDGDSDLVELAKKYYKKRSYIFQGLVADDPIENASVPENPIRRFVLNKSILEIVRAGLMDPEVEVNPTDYDRGRDFRLTRTKQGQYSNYSTSKWSMRERSLSDQEREAIDKFGLFKLSDYLPPKPTEKQVEIIREMFQASLEEQPYDPDRWGEHFRPFGLNAPNNSGNGDEGSRRPTPASVKAAPPVDDDVASAEVEEAVPAETGNVTDALSRLKSQSQKPAKKANVTEDAAEGGEEESGSAKAILDVIRRRQQT